MHERSKSRSSSDNDHKSLKIEEIFFNGKSFKQGKTDCDISTKNKYCSEYFDIVISILLPCR